MVSCFNLFLESSLTLANSKLISQNNPYKMAPYSGLPEKVHKLLEIIFFCLKPCQ